ncbi:MAG TPA: hypothetical protein VHE83_00745 [Mycobacteriales bacterium]|nr:hypothetical protein [Mycobacteriales bacterium]
MSACELFPSRPSREGCARCIGGDASATCAYTATTKTAVSAGRKRRRRPVGVEKYVRAALGAYAVAIVGGHVGADYVGADHGFSLVVPVIIGVVCGWAASRAVGVTRAWSVRLVAALYAAISSPLGFRVNGEDFGGAGRWLPPIVAAVVGAVLGTYIDPRPRDEPSKRKPARTT